MINIEQFVECLINNGVKFFSGVPDSLLNDFCNYLQENIDSHCHVIAANEGNAIALAAGYNLATNTVPLVYMQNSGIGNALNPLLSLSNEDVFSIPMVLLIGWRGDPSVEDHVQHKKQGAITQTLMEILDIPYRILIDDSDESIKAVEWAVSTASEQSSPTALIVKKNVLSQTKKIEPKFLKNNNLLSREEAIECILKYLPEDSRYIATTGRATRELYSLREKYKMPHSKDFLNVGAMGHASSIGVGLALGSINTPVVCLDGDAALIMHLGSLTTAGKLCIPNFIHVVLNNGVHESVGGQPSAGNISKLTDIAENAGYLTIGKAVNSEKDIIGALESLFPAKSAIFLEVTIRKGIRSDLEPLKIDHHKLKDTFIESIIER